jgi:bifunctional non-homologous end joining protein LigD
MEGNHSVRPRFVAPMLSKRIQKLPKRDAWFYEVQRAGHRALAVKEGADVRLYSPNGTTLDCPEVMDAVRKLDARSAVIDCQLIALDEQGQCRFEPLGLKRNNHTRHLCAFDLLHLDGRDLTSEPIERRKQRLCTLTLNTGVLFTPSLDCDPDMLIEQVALLSLAGIIAKRRGSTYEAGTRGGNWVILEVNGASSLDEALKRTRNGRPGGGRHDDNPK